MTVTTDQINNISTLLKNEEFSFVIQGTTLAETVIDNEDDFYRLLNSFTGQSLTESPDVAILQELFMEMSLANGSANYLALWVLGMLAKWKTSDAVTELHLECMPWDHLATLPDTMLNLTNLKTLILSECKLTSLPESIENLTLLKNLRLNDNQLTSLPDTIGNLTLLKHLSLYDNQLTELPETIGNLTQLEYFYLEDNQLTKLPDTIENLTLLKTNIAYLRPIGTKPIFLSIVLKGLSFIFLSN